MDFAFSEEQAELASTLRSLLARHADSAAVRAAAASETGYDPALWRLLSEQIGVAALAIPEEYDGAGFSLFESLVALQEVGRSLAPSPLLASVVTAEALLAGEPGADRDTLLGRVAAGEVATLAWDPSSGAALVEEAGGTLTGVVPRVLFGDQASVLVVAARTADGVSLVAVDPASVERAWTPAMDTTLRLATVTFDATPATVLVPDAAAALERARLVALVGVAALQVGCAEAALEMTVAYTRERVQFGRPIGSFQALKHRMADMLVQLEMSRSASWAASYAVSHRTDDAGTLALVAASYCSDALSHIAAETIQLHGGIAITWEHDAQLVFKRAHALGQLVGQPHQHRAALQL